MTSIGTVSLDIEGDFDAFKASATRAVSKIPAQTVPVDADTSQLKSGLKGAEADAERSGRQAGAGFSDRLNSALTADTSRIKADLGGVEAAAGKSGGDAGSKFAANFETEAEAGVDKLKTGMAAGGALAGAGLTAGLLNGLDVEAASDKITAQLGLTAPESKRVGKVAGSLYSGAYGDSLESVNEAIRGVIQNVDGMRGASSTSLERISGKVLNVAQAFDQDLGGTTRAVGQLMRTGLAKNADEALDIITRGFQTGADKSEDFLDTLNEYGTQFRKLGLDGETATGLITQGLKAGARDADIVADALKEFGIRSQEAIETLDSKGRPRLTALGEAFAGLGLDGYKMQDQIGAGGKKAAAATDLILDRLRNVPNAVDRNTTAVALFGTQAEDLGDALYALDPSEAAKGLGQVGGAADKMGKDLGDNAKTRIEAFKRQALMGVTNIIGNQLIPAFNATVSAIRSTVKWFEEHKTVTYALAGAIGVLVAGFGAMLIVNAVKNAIIAMRTAVLALNIAMLANPAVAVTVAIAALTAAFIIAYRESETFRNIVDSTFAALKTIVEPALNYMAGLVTDVLAGVVQTFRGFGQVIKGIVDVIAGILTLDFGRAWEGVKGIFGGAINVILGSMRAMTAPARAAIKAVVDAVTGVVSGAVSTMTNAIGSVMSALYNGIKNAGGNVYEAAKDRAAAIISGIRSILESVTNAAGDIVSRLVNGIKNAPGNIYEAIKDRIAPITKFLADLPADALKAGADIVSKLAEGLKGGAETLGEEFAKAIKNAINSIIKKINSATKIDIKGPGPIPDFHFKGLGLPLLATGGEIRTGGWAIVGERGPELVNVPTGSTVFDAGQTRDALTSSAVPIVHVHFDDPTLKNLVRVEIEHDGRRVEAAARAGAIA